MLSCPKCGADLEEGRICDCSAKTLKFGESMKNRMGIGVPEQNAADTYERGINIVPGCIKANEGEIPIKQYNIAVLRNLLKFERAEGRLQLTNKRVIFRAAGRSAGGRTTLQHEFAVGEIAGIEARRNYKFSFLYLIFAALIISFSGFLMSGKVPLLAIMYPPHVQEARAAEDEAVSKANAARQRESLATSARKNAEKAEEQAAKARANAEKREREGGGYYGYYYGDPKQDRINAQNVEKKAVAQRELAEKEEKQAIAQRELAETVERDAIRKRESTEQTWAVLMTVLGLVLGIGGLIPFFTVYKRFGLKLLILNLAVFGFSLSLTASESHIFYLFLILTDIIILFCISLFCFRPNLVITIKNRVAEGGPVDIRRDIVQSGKGIGFAEVIPTEETEGAIREIGAIIGDIQSSGDLAVKKWAAKPAGQAAAPPVSASVDASAAPPVSAGADATAESGNGNAPPAEGGNAGAPPAESGNGNAPPAEGGNAGAPPAEGGNADALPGATAARRGGAQPYVASNPHGGSGKKGALIAGIIILCIAAAVTVFILQPGHNDFYEKGKAYHDVENYAEAVNHFSKAIKLKPTVAHYYYWRGTAHLSKEIYSEAIADFTEAIRLDPQNALYRADRASAYYAAKDYDKAVDGFTEAIRLDPKDSRYYNSRGNAYRLKEQYAKAASDHTEAIKLNPNDARYHNNLGVAYFLNKDYDNAAAAYTEAIRLAPDNARYYNNRGSAHSLKKDFDGAVADFTEASRLDPDNGEYKKNLEKAVGDQGRIRR